MSPRRILSVVALRVAIYVPCFAIGALWLARTGRLGSPAGLAVVVLVSAAITGFGEAVLVRNAPQSGRANRAKPNG